MKLRIISTALLTTLAIPAANAALIANGDLETAVTEHSNNSGTSNWSLNTTTNNILVGGVDTVTHDAGQWVDLNLAKDFDYNATGGNGGGGGFTNTAANDNNNRFRGVLFFADDGKATTGSITATIDIKLATLTQHITAELYGWNDGETGATLSMGGSTTAWNTTTLTGGTETLFASIELGATTINTWETKTIGTVELGTGGVGFDNYAWRIGVKDTAVGEAFAFDNLVVTPVPEPSSTALLGLGGLALILRRRRS